MTPNGTWSVSSEKGPVLPETSRFERWRKNRLLVILIILATFMFLLAIASGAVLYYHYIPQTKKSTVFEKPCEKMLCSFGSRCLVDEGTGRAYCRCDETCSEVFAPVCGSDGATYSSECQLRLSSCTQQRKIVTQRQGPCDVQDPCEAKTCNYGSFCRASLDGRRAQCVCPEKCSPSSKGQSTRSVCGTDGKDYGNECELKRASCREMRDIQVKFRGVCDPCDGVECPTSQICQLDDSRNPICRCNSVCSPDFRPMCGSDGKTYTNECTLRVEACKSRKNIRIIYTGQCSSGANPCDNLQCGPSQDCDIDRHGKATCVCDDSCEPVMRPVCGSDGETYHNECEMRKQSCLSKRYIKMAYRGECGARGPCYKYQCSYGAQCVVKSGFTTCECPTCTEEFEPVCGTDGISYTNNCKLKREACEQKTEIAVAYSGLCNGCEKKRCEYYAVCESDGRGNGKCVCPQNCITVESPVCGTDEVTYQNECEMRIEACRKAQYVMVVSKGPCDLCQHVHCKYGARCEDGRCVCPTDCPKSEEPVCANDGMTYQNECEMRHAACVHDQELNMLFYGECDEVGETQDEGSGAGPDCEEKTCKFGGICEYGSDGLPQCLCNFQCPVTFEPVCGSNGRRYDNECRLREASCMQQKSVMPVHIEMCEEFREVPCDGELPLVDHLTGKDYFCGEGVGSKLCPPGSYCHKSTAFSKCCKEVILIKTCSESLFGCCEDGKVTAQGPNYAGCPSVCNCNRLGSYGLTCEPLSKQCFCKPGVGSPKCDRCEPGYWGLHRITEENSNGCTPCACNLYGSVRDDCEQMTGRCVCKHGIQGMKCDICPEGTILGPDGCMDESIAQPVSGSCDDLVCFHGATCVETEDDKAQCICDIKCSFQDNRDIVCGSDGNTYGAECQMKQFSCRYQKTIVVVSSGACNEDYRSATISNDFSLSDSFLDMETNFTIQRYNIDRRQRYVGPQTVKKSFIGNSTYSLNRSCGNSQVKLGSIETNGRMQLELGFITFRGNGVVFYSSSLLEDNSFFALIIKNKHLEFRFGNMNETTILRPQKQVSFGKYHHVAIRCFPHFVMVLLDRTSVAMDSRKENYSFYKHPIKMSVGFLPKLPKRFEKEFTKQHNFFGCICHFKKGKSHLEDLESNYARDYNSTVQFEDLLKSTTVTLPCSPMMTNKKSCLRICPHHDEKNLLIKKFNTSVPKIIFRTVVNSRSRLTILFSMSHNTGLLLFWSPRFPSYHREFYISIKRGRVQMLALQKGQRKVLVENPKIITNFKLHNATIERYKEKLRIILDDEVSEAVEEVMIPHFHTSDTFYVGGYGEGENSTSNVSSIFQLSNFRGCVQAVLLDDSPLNLTNIAPKSLMCKPS